MLTLGWSDGSTFLPVKGEGDANVHAIVLCRACEMCGVRPDAPKLISLDEAFVGVDETSIRDMFCLMVEFEFDFMINSQIFWEDYDTVTGLAVYQRIRLGECKICYAYPICLEWKSKKYDNGEGIAAWIIKRKVRGWKSACYIKKVLSI